MSAVGIRRYVADFVASAQLKNDLAAQSKMRDRIFAAGYQLRVRFHQVGVNSFQATGTCKAANYVSAISCTDAQYLTWVRSRARNRKPKLIANCFQSFSSEGVVSYRSCQTAQSTDASECRLTPRFSRGPRSGPSAATGC